MSCTKVRNEGYISNYCCLETGCPCFSYCNNISSLITATHVWQAQFTVSCSTESKNTYCCGSGPYGNLLELEHEGTAELLQLVFSMFILLQDINIEVVLVLYECSCSFVLILFVTLHKTHVLITLKHKKGSTQGYRLNEWAVCQDGLVCFLFITGRCDCPGCFHCDFSCSLIAFVSLLSQFVSAEMFCSWAWVQNNLIKWNIFCFLSCPPFLLFNLLTLNLQNCQNYKTCKQLCYEWSEPVFGQHPCLQSLGLM